MSSCSAKKGGFKDATHEDMLTAVLAEVAKRGKLSDKALVEDTAVGTVLPPGSGATVSRMAQVCDLGRLPG